MSSADQIVSAVVRGLYEGTYVAGQKLVETDLISRYGVGRGTVREALRRLAAEGLATVSLHRGARIRSLTREDARDLLEVIEALGALASRLAAERLSKADDEQVLRASLSRLSKLSKLHDPFEFARERGRLYRRLAHISGNRELARLIPLVQAHLVRAQFRSAYDRASEELRMDGYTEIVDAVLKKDATRAERAMRRHIRRTGEAIDKLPDEYFAL
jgi:DNA-binding GntR family transcriptional regulator